MLNKRTASIFLITALLIGSVGCSSDVKKSDDTSDHVSDETTKTDDTEKLGIMEQRALLDDGLGNIDFNNAEFNIVFEKQSIADSFVAEESTGEALSDAVYNRMIEIEERFNIKIKTTATGIESSQHTRQLATLLFAGDDSYDLYQMHSMEGPNIALQGGLLNLYDFEQIDFSQPWWLDFMIDEQSFMGQLYCFNSPIETNVISGGVVLYFNRDLIEDRKLDDPYELVQSGTWTMDKLYGMVKDAYTDLNSNDTADIDDFFGYAGYIGETYYTPVSAGLNVLTKKNDDLELTINSEKTISYIEKWYKLYSSDAALIQSGWSTAEQETLFKSNRAIFVSGGVSSASNVYRDSDINFGIIPMPKLDENQENYYTMGGRTQYGIPITAKDPDMSATIVEAMTCAGYKSILPTYYETALKNKYMRDEDYYEQALEVMDIIEKSLCVPFWYTYGDSKLFHTMMSDLYSKDSTDFASYYASKQSIAQSRINTILEYFSKNS